MNEIPEYITVFHVWKNSPFQNRVTWTCPVDKCKFSITKYFDGDEPPILSCQNKDHNKPPAEGIDPLRFVVTSSTSTESFNALDNDRYDALSPKSDDE